LKSIAAELQKLHPDCTFEIINFDTKGDQILNIALPKIGDKGLFTKELEEGLENESIDFVVHSLKDLPCQTMPEKLIISGLPPRQDPTDSLVISARLASTKKCLDDLEPNSVIGTSSLRRISQLKAKYPLLKFETIRGNLQTRFAKLDNEDGKYDAMVLATAGLIRMKYTHRISQILTTDICFYAVSQGALAVECRRNDLEVIRMLNALNDEDTLLQCIAERTFLAKLEGGCSAPVGVNSKITKESLFIEGCALNLDGSQRIYDKFEIKFAGSAEYDMLCPALITPSMSNEDKLIDIEEKPKTSSQIDERIESSKKRFKKEEKDTVTAKLKGNPESTETKFKHFSFIVDLNIDENKLRKAELCGLHLAQKLIDKGADVLIKEVKMQVLKSTTI
jgi:hydroxymethylbilane synthase